MVGSPYTAATLCGRGAKVHLARTKELSGTRDRLADISVVPGAATGTYEAAFQQDGRWSTRLHCVGIALVADAGN